MTSILFHLALLGSLSIIAAIDQVQEGKVTSLDVVIPPTRHDDLFYNVNLDFNGQQLPLFLDTGSGDIMVASTQCSNTDPNSGCFGVEKEYFIDKTTRVLTNESFGSVLGLGTVLGNQSIIPVRFNDVEVPDLATPLLYYAVKGEFQNGSFAGIWGLAPRNVSRQWYFNHRLPPIDAMITQNRLKEPVFSLSLPRYADPDSPKTGKLTLGGIEDEHANLDIQYADIIDTPNFNYDGFPLAPQSWTAILQSVRLNNHELNLSAGSIDPSGKYISDMDSGAQLLYFRRLDFEALIPLFDGNTTLDVGNGYALYYECSKPQFLELKYNNRWYPIDPLDMIIPGDHQVQNGTEFCRAPLGIWDREFGDSIIGVPFLRSVFTVFDYVSPQLYSVQPRLGFASTVDSTKAKARYPGLYQRRMGITTKTTKTLYSGFHRSSYNYK